MHPQDGEVAVRARVMEGVCVLQGTFETLSLAEVLGLLASARKTGALWLDAGSMSGVVYVEDGHCRAVELGDRREPLDDAAALLDRLIDVCFGVARLESGSFRFAAEEPAPWLCPEPVELSDAMVEVEHLLKQWREIRRVIPSLDCRPRLLDALVVGELVIDRDRWSLLVAIDGRRTVRDLVERTGRPALELCHTLLELVDAGALGIFDAAEPPAPPAGVAPAADPEPVAPPVVPEPEVPEPVAPPEPAMPRPPEPASAPPPPPPPPPPPVEAVEPPPVEPPPVEPPHVPEPEPEPVVAEPVPEPVGATAGADRGTFLRMFSGLREN